MYNRYRYRHNNICVDSVVRTHLGLRRLEDDTACLPACQPANDEDEDEENADNEVDINMTIYLLKWFIFFF